MTNTKRYYFNYIENCNMCGSKSDAHKVLGKRLNTSQGKNPKHKIGVSTTVVKCTNCRLIYANPQPVPFDIQDHYGIPPEVYWKDNYFQINENYFKTEIDTLNKLIELKTGMKSLDIGAGLGKQMIALTKIGFETFGLEPSKQFYERAISKMGIHPDRLKLGMIEEADYPENYFDFISFGAVLEHLYNPSESILKTLRWLKTGGIIHIEVPSSDWLVGKIINLYYRLKCTDYVGNLSPMHEPYHLYEFSIKSFQEHAKNNGYQLTHHQHYVSLTFMPKILDYFLKPYMRLTNTGMMLTVWLKKQ